MDNGGSQFLGQRHDNHFLDGYVKQLPPPKTGPYVASVSLLTPFVLLAQFSSTRIANYSAQQAELDHRKMVETVRMDIQIQLTDSFGAMIPNPAGQTSGTPWDSIQRPSDFWRDFQIQVVSDKQVLTPFIYSGEPGYVCGPSDLQGLAIGDYCTLVGAVVHLEFLADAFGPDNTTILINPPEGEPVNVAFDLSSLR